MLHYIHIIDYYVDMLTELTALLKHGAVQHVGEVLMSAVSSAFHTVTSLLDLPVDVGTLESSIRFVKTSGLENSNQVPVVASVGLTIGGGGFKKRSNVGSSSSVSSYSSKPKASDAAPASSSVKTGMSSLEGSSGFASVVPRAMLVFLVVDIISIILVKQSMLNPCVSKLGIVQWVIGGVLLGFPATMLVDAVRQEYSFRSAFVSELVLLFGSFLWLCYGGSMIFNAVSACVDTIAPLWWLSYASSVLSLSVAGTVIFCMVVTTVLSLIYGSTQQNK